MVELDLRDPRPGEVLVRNTFMSVDPYMRGRMNDLKSYIPPFILDSPMDGGAVGEVLLSRDETLKPGDVVLHQLGWREHAVLPAAHAKKIDTAIAPSSAYLGVLGMPGLTAYVGLTRIAELQPGDRVLVSGAAGAVGSVAGQMARLLGAATVVGLAGSPEKVAWLEELGFDTALDYNADKPSRLIAPYGPYDVYFDNVGGPQLEAAISNMADFGRIACCGAIAVYNSERPEPGPRNLMMLTSKRLTVQGFIVTDHREAVGEFYQRAGEWLASGDLRYRETVVDGLDHAVEAFLGLHRGENLGKMIVRLSPEGGDAQ